MPLKPNGRGVDFFFKFLIKPILYFLANRIICLVPVEKVSHIPSLARRHDLH